MVSCPSVNVQFAYAQHRFNNLYVCRWEDKIVAGPNPSAILVTIFVIFGFFGYFLQKRLKKMTIFLTFSILGGES